MYDSTDGSDAPVAGDGLPTLSRNQLRSTRRLLQRKTRQHSGEFLIEGAQAVREALLEQHRRPGLVRLLIVDEPQRHAELLDLAGDARVVQTLPGDARQLSDTVTSQGVWAVVADITARLADLPPAPRLVVICAQVRDPGNAGTVIRCADAFGAEAVLLTEGSVEPTNPKTVRASVGSIFHLPVVDSVGFGQAVDWARSRGLQVLAADAGGRGLDELADAGELARPTAWVFGNEAWGLPADALALADRVVSIPMWGRAESLNLSTAAAVCLYASGLGLRTGSTPNGLG